MFLSGGGEISPIVVVGGGPAGMLAAIAARQESKRVVLYNKNPWPGKKVAAIPQDELYFSEKLPPAKMASRFEDKAHFVGPIFRAFNYSDLQKLLKKIGIEIESDGLGRFRANGHPAGDIFKTMADSAVKLGVEYIKSARVTDILVSDNQVEGIKVNGSAKRAAAVILSTGSFSSPKHGATRDGYNIASRFGHTTNKIRPAMVDLVTKEKLGKILAGEVLKNIKINILFNGQIIYSEIGDIKFTAAGISGPAILNHSAEIIEKLQSGSVEIALDLLPEQTKDRIEATLIQLANIKEQHPAADYFNQQFGSKMSLAIRQISHIDLNKSFSRLSNLERKALILALKDFHLTVKDSKPFNSTRGVLGGVSTDFIDPETGQSTIVKGLYFAGAVMDVLGPWGGYNMQFAFSSGYVAGRAAAMAVEQLYRKPS